MTSPKALALALSLCAWFAPVDAYAVDWKIQRLSGEVNVRHTSTSLVALSASDTVRAGDRISTGANGRIMLVRGKEAIVIAPGSELIVPADQVSGRKTTLLQSAGEVTFEVEKRNVQHFEVQTPFLAAVVKGTRFTVKVNASSSSVAVERGVVEVLDFDTGQMARVNAGQLAKTAAVSGAGLALSGSGKLGTITQLQPRKSRFEQDGFLAKEASLTPGKSASGF